MAELITGTILAFLAIVGAAELLRALTDYMLRPSRGKVAFIVAISGHEEQTEYLLRSLIFKARAVSFLYHKPCIIVVDRGMDDETKKICETLADELGCVEICSDVDFTEKYL